MKCPHCGQKHPNKVIVCPVTGKSLVETHPETEMRSPTLINDVESSETELPPGGPPFKKAPAPVRAMRRRLWLKFILVVLAVVIGVAILAAASFFIWRQISSRQESQAASVAVQISIGLTQTAMALITNMPAQPSATAPVIIIPTPTESSAGTQVTNEPIATASTPSPTIAPGRAFTPTVGAPTIALGLTPAITQGVPTSVLVITSTPSSLTTATNTLAAPACSGTLPSRLSSGTNAKVVYILNMREEPGVHSLVVASLNPNDQVLVLNDPPVCADNYLWWHIQSIQANLSGWAAEGGGDQYWLIP